jgi:hypothetical protein
MFSALPSSISIQEAASVVMLRQTQRAAAGIQTISGSVSSLCVWIGPVTTPDREPSVGESVSLFREPDAGNLPVRLDERGQGTEPSQTGLRGRGESQVKHPPGDYSYCACSRLYSLTDQRSKRKWSGYVSGDSGTQVFRNRRLDKA